MRPLCRAAVYRLLLEALRRIPLDQQVVLELSFWEDLSGPEIAQILAIPEATVRTRLYRATARLRVQLSALAAPGQPLPDTAEDLQWALRLREQIGEGPGERRKR